MDKTFLFLKCRVLSPSKMTSIIRISPSVKTGDGKTWMGDCLESLSDWYLCHDMGADTELEPELLAKLKKGPLVPQVQEAGWLGIALPFPPRKETSGSMCSITLALTDGGEETHEFKFDAPWPVDEKSEVIAKHARQH
jgi:hypothetical protein